MKPLHPIQLQILLKLLYSQTIKYSELKPSPDMENNLFDYHLDQLIAAGFVEKTELGYTLTSSGKEYSSRINNQNTTVTRQGKISVRICCIRNYNQHKQYLLYTRLKQPYYGCQQLFSGKVEYGEKIINCARRELKEETGLEGVPSIVNLKHFVTYSKNTHQLISDNYLYLCVFKNPSGNLNPQTTEGKFEWVNESDLRAYFTNPLESIESYLQLLEKADKFNGRVEIEEEDFYTEKY